METPPVASTEFVGVPLRRRGDGRRKDNRGRAVAALMALGLVVSACGGGDAGSSSGSETGDNGAAAASGFADTLDSTVLSGDAVTHTGEAFDLGSLAGQDLVVWFWAPW